MPSIVAGIEMGGTGCKAAISDENGQYDPQYSFQIVTTTPEETLKGIYDWLESKRNERNFLAIGIACFGPVDLDKTSKTYGYITTTPKPGWQYANVVGAFQRFAVPIAFETDVNAPAMTEAALRGDSSAAYITVGTGFSLFSKSFEDIRRSFFYRRWRWSRSRRSTGSRTNASRRRPYQM